MWQMAPPPPAGRFPAAGGRIHPIIKILDLSCDLHLLGIDANMTPMSEAAPSIVVGLNAVIIALTDGQPRVLTVALPESTPIEGGVSVEGPADRRVVETLPTGPLDPSGDRTLELALRRWVRTYTGLELGYVEQLYTFGDRFRDPREAAGGSRVVSAAYLALVRESTPPHGLAARWRSVYRFFPWEDWRRQPPQVISRHIEPALNHWIDGAGDGAERNVRKIRSGTSFGLGEAPWDGERVLERYELLYELGLTSESVRDGGLQGRSLPRAEFEKYVGLEMAFDHRRILATAVGRIRAKIRYRPVVFELMPETFTLLQLQQAVEALAGVLLHKQNFRRLVEQGGLVEGTGQFEPLTGGRPAELFRFRREVLLERPAPGVGLPGARR